MRTEAITAAVVAALFGTVAAAQTATTIEDRLEITLQDGRILTGSELTGAILTVRDDAGLTAEIRIRDAFPDPNAPERRWLYTLERRNAGGAWVNTCAPGPQGLRAGFPVAIALTEDGRIASTDDALMFTCTSGAVAKCIRMGYAPWGATSGGQSLAPYFQACTRMVRADYCGDGLSATRDGMLINVYDKIGIQIADTDARLTPEAAWGPDGAVCVRRTRIPALSTLTTLAARCPGLVGRLGPEVCAPEAMQAMDNALIWNDSIPAMTEPKAASGAGDN